MQPFTCAVFTALLLAAGASSQESGDLYRLPGQGEVTDAAQRPTGKTLVPGGGLLMSFDADADGRVTPVELRDGIAHAFDAADTNRDGALSALEQQAWARQLPTRDESLANPVRFDPNLDRQVSRSEFESVIDALARALADPASGEIDLETLVVTERRGEDLAQPRAGERPTRQNRPRQGA